MTVTDWSADTATRETLNEIDAVVRTLVVENDRDRVAAVRNVRRQVDAHAPYVVQRMAAALEIGSVTSRAVANTSTVADAVAVRIVHREVARRAARKQALRALRRLVTDDFDRDVRAVDAGACGVLEAIVDADLDGAMIDAVITMRKVARAVRAAGL